MEHASAPVLLSKILKRKRSSRECFIKSRPSIIISRFKAHLSKPVASPCLIAKFRSDFDLKLRPKRGDVVRKNLNTLSGGAQRNAKMASVTRYKRRNIFVETPRERFAFVKTEHTATGVKNSSTFIRLFEKRTPRARRACKLLA